MVCCLFFSIDRNVIQSLGTFVRDPLIKCAFDESVRAFSTPLIYKGVIRVGHKVHTLHIMELCRQTLC